MSSPAGDRETDAPAAPRFELQQLVNASGIGRGQLVRVVNANGIAWRLALDEGLSFDQADRWAVKCGLLPYDVWPDWLEHSIRRAQKMCEADDCAVTFFPSPRHPTKRFCSPTCRSRVSVRAAFAKNPEAKRAAVRAYDAKNRDTKRRANRAYYRLNREARLAWQREYDRVKRAAARTDYKDENPPDVSQMFHGERAGDSSVSATSDFAESAEHTPDLSQRSGTIAA